MESLEDLIRRVEKVQRRKSAGLISDRRLASFHRALVRIDQRCEKLGDGWGVASALLQGYPTESAYVSMQQITRPINEYRGPYTIVRFLGGEFSAMRIDSEHQYHALTSESSDTYIIIALPIGAKFSDVGSISRGVARASDLSICASASHQARICITIERQPTPAKIRYV
jgi:hypothetical protein